MGWKYAVWIQINELDIFVLAFSCTKYLLNFTETGFVWLLFCSLFLIFWGSQQGFSHGFL